MKTTQTTASKLAMYKKILAGASLSVLMGSAAIAQTSYNANTIPIVGANNAAFGASALSAISSGNYDTGCGINAMRFTTTGNYNTAVGGNALYANTSGTENTAIGVAALGAITTANDNTSVGAWSLRFNTASYNNAFGSYALTSNTSGTQNSAFGSDAMYANTTGYENTAFGRSALRSNVSGYDNTAVGLTALYTNNNGVYNSAVGKEALYYNNSGSFNVAMGSRALYQNVTGSGNTATGHLALTNANASDNAAFGNSALYSTSSGRFNTGIGNSACSNNNVGYYNTALGYQALVANTTGSFNTAVGALADMSTFNLSNASAIGYGAIVNNSNRMWLGNGALADIWTSVGGLIAVSDQRFKSSVNADDVKGLEFIKLLRPVVYNFESQKLTEFMAKNMPDSVKKKYLAADFSKSQSIRQSGFLAQEVEAAAKQAGYNFSGLHSPENDNDTYGISYATFVVPLVKAVQEQQKMIDDQKAVNDKLQQQVIDQQQQINDMLAKSGTATGIGQVSSANTGFAMGQNEPNPFTNETVVKYTLPQTTGSAYMAVYDLTGKQITTFPINQKGDSSMTITSEKLAAGIYIYSIVADGKVMDSKRMIVAGK